MILPAKFSVKRFAAALLMAALAGCGAPRYEPSAENEAAAPAPKAAPKTNQPGADGGYYLDDGPADISPEKLAAIPDAVPVPETMIPATARPYTALGQRYEPFQKPRPYRARGNASWYGKRYHGRKTASGETYDMFAMTAAHPVLPIPSYARVTRPDTQKTVVVRINDRGPFLRGRIIDLSYAAAHRLDLVRAGSGEVIVEAILFSDSGARLPPPSATTEAPAGAEAKLPAAKTYIQLGAFAQKSNAEKQRRAFAETFANIAHKIYVRDGLHLLLAGPYADGAAARGDDETLCAAGWCGFLTRAP